jgi:hypothetical protein
MLDHVQKRVGLYGAGAGDLFGNTVNELYQRIGVRSSAQ